METVQSGPRLAGAAVASAALLAAALTPVAVAPELGAHTLATVSAEVTLAADAVTDVVADLQALIAPDAFDFAAPADAFDIPDLADTLGFPGIAEALDVPGPAAAFDIVGLFNAEVAAAVGLFERFISLPGTLFNDVSNLVTSLINLDFGMAFSEAVGIPIDIVNYALGLPGAVVNTVINMVLVLPGEYLFNFG